MLMGSGEAWDVVVDVWGTIMDYADYKSFDYCVSHFQEFCSSWPLFFEYFNNMWIFPRRKSM